ncbi:plasmid mobilization relaxosome protein MobC [Ensifer sp. Root127]|uniref:plasmid mobilization protein n=1 Tax=Ensifer sp. Root127 TaxID=1736440 RepID=UPI00070F8F0B|nr:plasmid mobilization relaxosome protein MobC [Ensifer sp. Root127]KQW84465.1 hypothetical protein ASD03_01510 [Ensifer sp. Root127]
MRDRIIRIRTTTEELARIQDLARSRGLSISEMLRRAALGVRMPARGFDQTNIVLLTQTLGELGRIGGNLNQIARRANTGRLAGHDAELTQTLAGIDGLRDRIREIVR